MTATLDELTGETPTLDVDSAFGDLVTSAPELHVWARLRALLPRYTDEERLDALSSKVLCDELCREDFISFVVLYLPHHIRQEDPLTRRPTGPMTMNLFHHDIAETVMSFLNARTGARSERHCFLGPRNIGKSTWAFLAAPLWLLAYGHRTFAAAYACTAGQAQEHLATFRAELQNNEKLRSHFPALCTPAKRANGSNIADRVDLYKASSGAAFGAKGLDSETLGIKIGRQRPDLLIIDDPEPQEGHYGEKAIEVTLKTLIDSIFYLQETATVIMSGTVNVAGSVMHQLVQSVRGAKPEAWIAEQRIVVHDWQGLLTLDNGTRISIWPQREGWSTPELLARQHTRDFRKNFMNAPVNVDSAYWVEGDFTYGPSVAVTRTVIAIDPNVRKKKTSDFTSIAVVTFSDYEKMLVVEEIIRCRPKTKKERRDIVLDLLARYPATGVVVVEGNNGGDFIAEALEDPDPLPVEVVTFYQPSSEPKEIGNSWLLGYYQSHPTRIRHARPFPDTEEQMQQYPHSAHDDDIDAIRHAVRALLLEAPFDKLLPGRVRT